MYLLNIIDVGMSDFKTSHTAGTYGFTVYALTNPTQWQKLDKMYVT